MLNLVCVGACYLDTILSVPHFPEEDSKLRATSLSVRRGGNCPNSLEVLQQLLKAQQEGEGHKVVRPYLISCLPSAEGPASARVRDSFGPDSPVDFTRCIYREQHDQPASSYIIRSEAAGTRTLVNYNDLPEMTVLEFQAAIDGLDRQDDIVTDTKVPTNAWWPNQKWHDERRYDQRNMTDKILACSTVGAGDTFIAGMLYGLLCYQEDWDTDTKLRFAVQLATRKVQVEGFGGIGTHVMGMGAAMDQKATPVS
ncbi:hypothetical protein PG996_015854 [Apiospora saccharicola]|uniref:Carbohydrate kinase PfkB domain-containing protein n=1 Tax=Apiospora saccharicola TaxID=335842 RepID=A0ABR1TMB3_9PEZI